MAELDPSPICLSCGRAVADEPCRELYHRLLVREQEEPAIGRFHGVAVPAYLLQHADEAGTSAAVRDGQFRMLQLFCARGLSGMLRMRDHLVRRNAHGAGTPSESITAATTDLMPLPDRTPPRRFAVTIDHVALNSFSVSNYESRVRAMAEATVDAWATAADTSSTTS